MGLADGYTRYVDQDTTISCAYGGAGYFACCTCQPTGEGSPVYSHLEAHGSVLAVAHALGISSGLSVESIHPGAK